MAFPQGISYIHNTLWDRVCVCVCACEFEIPATDINDLHESRIMYVCVCVCVCLHRLLFSWLKHISVGNNCTSLAQPNQPITKWRKPEPLGPPPIADTRVWLVGNMCASECVVCVSVCVFFGGGQWKKGPWSIPLAVSSWMEEEGMRFPWWWEWSVDKPRRGAA